jgi:hypothetical protein
MAVSVNILTQGSSNTDVTSPNAFYDTASISPPANKLIMLIVSHGQTPAGTTPTVTGGGLTWTLAASSQQGTGNQRVSAFHAVSASPGSGTVRIDFGAGVTISSAQWKILEFTDTAIDGSNGGGAFVQAVSQNDSGTSHDAGFAVAPTAGNATLCAIAINSADTFSTASIPYTACTLIGDQPAGTSPSVQLAVVFSATGSDPIGAHVTGSPLSGIVGFEIEHLAAPAASIAYRASAVNSVSSTGASTVLNVATPTGTINDDIMLAFVLMSSEATITAVPSGWNFLREAVTATVSGGGAKIRAYWKKAASEPGSANWGPWTGGDDVIVGIVSYDGCNLTDPIYDHDGASSDDSNDTTSTLPTVEVVGNGWVVGAFGFNPNASSANPPFPLSTPSMNERIDLSAPDSSWEQAVLGVYDEGPLAAGTSTARTCTLSGEDGRNVAIAISLVPAAATGGGVQQNIDLNIGVGGGTPTDGCMMGWLGNTYEVVKADEAIIGKQFACVRTFADTFTPPSETVKKFTQNGYLVLWSTKPPDAGLQTWRNIADGLEDVKLRAIMQGMKALNKEILYLFMHEPGGNSSQGSQTPTMGDPEDYIDAWKQVDKIAKEEGAHWKVGGNVYMGYCDTDNWALKNPNPMYPGSSIIDFLCHDKYNYYDFRKPTGTWKSFEEGWKALVALAKQLQKPIIIGEFGTHPSTSSYSVDTWFRDAAVYMTDNADAKEWIKGFCYFHKKHTSDWRFTEENILADSHPYQEASGSATHTGYVAPDPPGELGSGTDGWIDAFVNDTTYNNNDADYFTSRPFPLSGSGSPVPTTGTGGISTGEAWGIPSLLPTDTQIISMNLSEDDEDFDPIVSQEAWGTPTLDVGGDLSTQNVTDVGNIVSEEAWGIPTIARQNLLFPNVILEAQIGGAWVNLSPRMRDDDPVKVIYGRSAPLARFEAGTMSVTLDNRDRALEPNYGGSIFYPFLTPNVPIRLRAQFLDTGYDLFAGFVDSWEPQWIGRDGVTQVTATDGFKVMAGLDLPGSPFAREVIKTFAVESPDPFTTARKHWLRLSDDGSSGSVTDRFASFENAPIVQGEPQFGSTPLVFMEQDGSMGFDTVDDRVVVPDFWLLHPPFWMGFWVMFTGETFDRTFAHVVFDKQSTFGAAVPGLRIQFVADDSFIKMQMLSSSGNNPPTISEHRMPLAGFDLDHPYFCVAMMFADGNARTFINNNSDPSGQSWTWRKHGTSFQGNATYPPVIGNLAFTAAGYGPVAGALDEFILVHGAVYQSAMVSGMYTQQFMYQAGARSYFLGGTKQGAWSGQNTYERILAALEAINYFGTTWFNRPISQELPNTYRTFGPTSFQGNVLQYVQKAEESEQGALYIEKNGYVHVVSRTALTTQPRFTESQAWFGSSVHSVQFNGTTNNHGSTPDSGANSIVGDLTLAAFVKATDWTPPSVARAIIAKNQSYLFQITSDGRLYFQWWTTSTTNFAVLSDVLPWTTGAYWVAATIDVDNGSGDHDVRFWYAKDGDPSWTQHGGVYGGGFIGTTSIFNSTNQLQVGGFSAQWFDGTVYYADVRSGDLNATPVAVFNPANSGGKNSWVEPRTGETWTMTGAAWSFNSEIPYESVIPDSGDEDIINEVEVSREGGAVVYVVDQESQLKYQPKNFSVTDLMLQDDDQVLEIAEDILARYSVPRLIIRSMKLKAINSSGSQSVLLQILQRRLLDRVTVNVRPPGGGYVKSQGSNIQKITHTISLRKWECEWELR